MTQRRGSRVRRLEHLKAVFERHGLCPNKQLGQNFLLDRNQVLSICRDAELFHFDTVLEVGPGSGLLSETIAATGARLLCVELDHGMAGVVGEVTAEAENVEILEADILRNKNAINPEVLGRVGKILAEPGETGGSLKCVSNLPYCIAGPFMANLCADPLPWSRGVFLIQYEMAERLVAKPGCKEYGNLTIAIQLATKRVKILRSVPPQVFWPRPKVKSAVVMMDFLSPDERVAVPWSALRRITTAIFSARRKTLQNAFKGLFGKGQKEKQEHFISRLPVDPGIRGDKLSPTQLVELAELLLECER
ncbi:MAG: 16S rRNA (adenine(1518)-N(6)/adenine(1519)-N(6))-dimethyltransferase RsmA [Planctomycetota bacterium]|jgi:16S rRNA (adenine1518-N6/adenine1519-N6)-dimethyltransferase